MIYDSLKHLERYEGIFPRLYRGLELLRTTDFSTLEDKLYEVEGRDLFFSLQSYDSKPANDTPEAHRDYIDIQFLVEGEEKDRHRSPGGYGGGSGGPPGQRHLVLPRTGG